MHGPLACPLAYSALQSHFSNLGYTYSYLYTIGFAPVAIRLLVIHLLTLNLADWLNDMLVTFIYNNGSFFTYFWVSLSSLWLVCCWVVNDISSQAIWKDGTLTLNCPWIVLLVYEPIACTLLLCLHIISQIVTRFCFFSVSHSVAFVIIGNL